MSVVQIILVVLVVLILIAMIAMFILNQEAERKRRVMSVIQGRGAAATKKATEKEVQDKRRAEISKKLKDSKGEDEGDDNSKKTPISLLIEQAGLNLSQKQYWVYAIVFSVVAVFFAKMMGQSPFVLLMVGVTGVFGVPRLVLKRMAAKRQKKFLEEFPDALEATVRLLKAGMPVSEAIVMISKEYTGPVGEEMSRIYDKQKIGVALHDAAFEATKRMPLTEMQMFATGLAIQAQTGASLSEVLINLSNVIRSRFRLKRKIKALSSEAIASAGIIGALPNLVATGMYFANREYIMILFTDPFGKVLLAGAVIWMCIGIFFMKVMINFKV